MTSWLDLRGITAIGAVSTAFYFMLKYFGGGRCNSKARLDGKTAIVTGSNTGIGKETVRDLSRRGARVIMACRNVEGAEKVAQDLRKDTHGEIIVMKLDLSSLSSIRAFAKEYNDREERLDILINNAGVLLMATAQRSFTEDGFEMTIGTNHLGPFLLTNLLLDKLKASKPSRIVNVSSIGHERASGLDLTDLHFANQPWSPFEAYRRSKLANVLFTRQLSKVLKKDEVTVYALHPGWVRTEISRSLDNSMYGLLLFPLRWLTWPFSKTAEQGAQTTLHCAVAEEVAGHSGRYYSDCKEKPASPLGQDDALAQKLWDMSAALVDLKQ